MLYIDCGNSALKCMWQKQISTFYFDHSDFIKEFTHFISALDKQVQVVLSQVVECQTLNPIVAVLNQHFNNAVIMAESEPEFMSLNNAYDEYQQLGVDRWLAMIAVAQSKTNSIVIDAGSWIKMDVVMSDGEHLGGLIISKNENDEDALLQRFCIDRANCAEQKSLFGKSTEQCLCLVSRQYGFKVMSDWLAMWIDHLAQTFNVVITGGDAEIVKQQLILLNETTESMISDIQCDENLVLLGLSIRYPRQNKS